MKIIIDLQAAQGLSRFRGIGRYSLALAKGLIRNRGSNEVIVVLNGMLEESIEPLRAALDQLLPPENIKVWYGVAPTRPLETGNKWRREASRLTREAFLGSLKPDLVLITSLFEGVGDSAVHSIGLLCSDFPTAVIFYDLIPLLEREKYLDHDQRIESFYFEGLNYLRNADLFLAISQSSKQELVDNLGIQPKDVVNISAAAEPHFRKINSTDRQDEALLSRFELDKPFVMYSGATDERKNHKRLIDAFAKLPDDLRSAYKLAIVGKINQADTLSFRQHAELSGIEPSDMVITGEVSDTELVHLYNLTDLFVFPSWHEGFGLPALEAMSCGAPVIASNTTSLPEVLGREDVLFDPFDVSAITSKMANALHSKALREEMSEAGLKQVKKFSWDKTAKRTWSAFENFHELRARPAPSATIKPGRQRLAVLTPLPPEKTGIADYAAELLPELALYYDIYVITSQKKVIGDWLNHHCQIRDVGWFKQNHMLFNRVLYQFGNSPYHTHMLDLLARKPGVVILHDFYLSAMLSHEDPEMWLKEIYRSHGYQAVADVGPSVALGADLSNHIAQYPSNAFVTDRALGVVVHSEYSRSLGVKWGRVEADEWSVVPLLRSADTEITREAARRALGIDDQDFVICTFGFLDPIKQNHRLLSAFSSSALASSTSCRLIYVGENHAGGYGSALEEAISHRNLSDRIQITGWVSAEDYQNYAAAADVAVQLRASSRGETSAAVLDCMKFGLATIVNANGALAELPNDCVFMLDDDFSDQDLCNALTKLWRNEPARKALGANARANIVKFHSPRICARMYADAIESFYRKTTADDHLLRAVSSIDEMLPTKRDLAQLSEAIVHNKGRRRQERILVDISALVKTSLKTGIERVVEKILRSLLENPPTGYRVEPVYADTDTAGYRYARNFTFALLGANSSAVTDDPIETSFGDIFLGLDLEQYVASFQAGYYNKLKRDGVEVYFVVYDLLPILLPDCFPTWAENAHAEWLRAIENATGLIAISRTVADDVDDWIRKHGRKRERPLKIGWFHLGADLEDNSVPVQASKRQAEFDAIRNSPTFLMVGTIEPRKGYLQVLEAFGKLWADGIEANLVIVGGEGWKGIAQAERETIIRTVSMIKDSPELNSRLFWFSGLNDAELASLYAKASCLIAASFGEGFGLPLIEAAHYHLPILARDIPVFREVAASGTTYFSAKDAAPLAASIESWLQTNQVRSVGQSDVTWIDWEQSKCQLLDVVLHGRWYKEVAP